jgi:hypothetical protein
MRSKLAQTASALNGSPSVNFTPSRNVNVHSVPSSFGFHSVASSGAMSAVPGLVPIRLSNICRVTRKVSPSVA